MHNRFLFHGEKQHQQIVCDFASFVIEIDLSMYPWNWTQPVLISFVPKEVV